MTVDKFIMVKDNLNKLTLKSILMTQTKQITKRKKKKTANESKYYYCSMYILLSNNCKRIVQKFQHTCAKTECSYVVIRTHIEHLYFLLNN